MRILYLAMESANWVIKLCNQMAEDGHEVTCLVHTLDDYEKDRAEKTHERLTVIRMPYSAFLQPQEFQENYFRLISKLKFDVVFGSHIPVAPLAEALSRTYKAPWGVMILDIPTDLMKTDRNRMNHWRFSFWVLRDANQVVFNTNIARDEYEKYTNQRFGDDNVITYGTNFIKEYRGAGMDIDGNYVLSICRLTPAKNCKLIPEALNQLKGKKSYVAIGRDGGELDLIKKKCEEYGIEFRHYSEISEADKYELIKNCSVLVYPQNSEYIGGLSPFEGMYVGKPVLVPNLRVLTDLYGEHTFSYFENNNATDLACAISFAQSFNKESQREWFEQNIQFAETEASYKTMSKKLIKVFERMTQ